MRAGETDKSIAIKDPDLFELIEKLLVTLKPSGPIDIDCFKTLFPK
jgi:carbamoyl-phosphate synthase large subunit